MTVKDTEEITYFLSAFPGYIKKSGKIVYEKLFLKIDPTRQFENRLIESIKKIQRELRNKSKRFVHQISYENYIEGNGTEWMVFGNTKNIESVCSTKEVLQPYLKGDINNVLIIGDTHEPFCKEGYLEFCREQQEKYNCGTVVHIGDLVDNHAMSYHQHDPDGKSPGDEFKLALEKCKEWYRVFPNVKICIGNHDALPFRKVFTAGLPSTWLKSYQEILQSPKTWEWDFVHQINGVIYQHGTGLSGEMAAINCARENRQSTVIGHLHTVCNTRYLASFKDLIFGVSVGCGIDHKSYAFAYGKENTRKPVMACAVVLNGELPINIPMKY